MTTKSKTPDKPTRLVSASWPKRVAKMSHFGTPGKSRIAQNRNFEARFVLGPSKKSKKRGPAWHLEDASKNRSKNDGFLGGLNL